MSAKGRSFLKIMGIIIGVAAIVLFRPSSLAATYCDINGDGHVNIKDIQGVIRCIINPDCSVPNSDVNDDGRVNIKDIQEIIRTIIDLNPSPEDLPYVFFNLHIHPENANKQDFDILENLINLADSYNTKLTLGFHIQFIDMILADPIKTQKAKDWQANGHEIAIEHHGPNHGGWDGYSDLPENISTNIFKTFFPGNPIIYPYTGSYEEAYNRYNQLAYPNIVRSGITTLKSDMSIGHLYDIDSLKAAPWADGRTSKVVVNNFNNHLTYRINARSGYLGDDWKINVAECDQATSDEVCGFIAHLSDYAEDRFETAKEVWGYYSEKDPEGKKRKTASWIMENHIIPNDLIIHERCGNTICDDEEFETKSCLSDCSACDKTRFGDYWANIHEGQTFNCDVGDSSKIYQMGKVN